MQILKRDLEKWAWTWFRGELWRESVIRIKNLRESLNQSPLGGPHLAMVRGKRVSFRRLDAKIWDVETLDAKTLGSRTPGRQKRCRLDANFFYILSRENLIVHTLRKRETKKRERKRTKEKVTELLEIMIIFRNRHELIFQSNTISIKILSY